MSREEAPESKVTYSVSTSIPHCTIDQYADHCGVSRRVIEGWIAREYVPVIRFGKYTHINLAKLTEDLKNT